MRNQGSSTMRKHAALWIGAGIALSTAAIGAVMWNRSRKTQRMVAEVSEQIDLAFASLLEPTEGYVIVESEVLGLSDRFGLAIVEDPRQEEDSHPSFDPIIRY